MARINHMQYLVCKLQMLLNAPELSASLIYILLKQLEDNSLFSFAKTQLKPYIPPCTVSKKDLGSLKAGQERFKAKETSQENSSLLIPARATIHQQRQDE